MTCFTDRQTFEPGFGLVFLRASLEVLRVLLPGLLSMASLVLFCIGITSVYHALPLWSVALLAPCIAMLLSFAALAVVSYCKNLLIGKFRPTIAPLWSSYVWLNEIVNGLYETVAAAIMTPLMGTPFISPSLRLMGCKIGKWVFLETTLFSEFDLVEIGDCAAINLGATIQTHLFEDRIMKSDRLKIGDRCSVGNMAVVLYGTEMKRGSSLEPLSVLMKGEMLPAFTRWSGIPTQPVHVATGESVRPAKTVRTTSHGRNASSRSGRSRQPHRVSLVPGTAVTGR
jgi:non-ribosomal peptide synthetase-like protein